MNPTNRRAEKKRNEIVAMGQDWESMWAAGLEPGQAFDASRVEPGFQDLINTGTLPKGTALVPGCGRGYAVAALGSAERKVFGLEVSTTAKAAADAYLSTAKAGDGSAATEHCTVVIDDFFTHTGQYDLVYDCTFLCAIPPSRREEWATQMSKLIKPGGEIVSLVFPLGDYEGGPPFALSTKIVEDLLTPAGFEVVSLTEVPEEKLARTYPRGLRGEYLYRWRRL